MRCKLICIKNGTSEELSEPSAYARQFPESVAWPGKKAMGKRCDTNIAGLLLSHGERETKTPQSGAHGEQSIADDVVVAQSFLIAHYLAKSYPGRANSKARMRKRSRRISIGLVDRWRIP